MDNALSDFAQTAGTNKICEIINSCILETTENESAEYNSICKIHRDSAGKITAISIDTEKVNKGIYEDKTVPEVVDELYKSSNIAHVRVAKLLNEKYL